MIEGIVPPARRDCLAGGAIFAHFRTEFKRHGLRRCCKAVADLKEKRRRDFLEETVTSY